MSEMVERVAKALEEATKDGLCPYEDAARAAIEAMREPTAGMRQAGSNAATDDLGIRWGIGVVECETVYRAMIDAALSEVEG